MSLRTKLHVLVVDDMSVSRGLIIQALDQIGIRNVDFSSDGETAFKQLASKPVHLVISDFNMPGADGLQLLAGLRNYEATARIGFILVSGTSDPSIIERGRQLGMNNFIKKPFSIEGMKTCIEQVVGRL